MHPTATAKTRRARSEYLDLPQKDWNMMIYPTKMMLYPRKTFDFTIPTEECDEKCVEKRRFPKSGSLNLCIFISKKNIQKHNFQVWNNSKLPRHLKKTTQSCSKKHICAVCRTET
jgi:mannosyltransferase OCH1-like enzyme